MYFGTDCSTILAVVLIIYIFFTYVQGDKLPIADSADFVIITMGHAKMSSLRHAAANTHVEVNAGGSAVIARAVEAAMNPTEGQRMLQAGFQGAILGGVSREKTSTSCGIDGMKRVDRLMEHSVVSENGQQVLVQQVQQSAKQLPPMPDIEVATKADLEAISTNISTISTLISETASVNITTVTTLVAKMREEMREETDKKIKSMKKKMQAMNAEQMQAMKAERDTKDAERDTKDAERDNKDAERDKLNASLQRDCSKNKKLIASLQRDRSKEEKRPADNQCEGTSQKKKRKTEPTYIFKDPNSSNGFMWKRFFDGIMHKQFGFNTIEEALKDMAEYFENLAP